MKRLLCWFGLHKPELKVKYAPGSMRAVGFYIRCDHCGRRLTRCD